MAPDQAAPIPAGWYPDPYGVAELRWWDGQNWTDSTHPPAPAAQPSTTPTVDQPVAAVQETPLVQPVQDSPAPLPAQQQEQEVQEQLWQAAVPAVQQSPETAAPDAHAPDTHDPDMPAPVSAVLTTPVQASADPVEPAAPASGLPSRRELRAQAQGSPVAPDALQPSATVPSTPPQQQPLSGFPPPSAVPTTATPSAFDWLTGENSSRVDESPVFASPPSTPAAPVASTTNSNDISKTSSPFDKEFSATSVPDSVTDPWARDPHSSIDDASGIFAPARMRKSTFSGWVIALTPLITALLVAGVVKGSENYPQYIPLELDWWMWAGGIAAVVYILAIVLAITDRRKLDWAGYERPAHWAWAILTAPVYLLMRMFAILKESGRHSILLWVWVLAVLVVTGAWFAAQVFAPELISGYTLPVF